MMWIRLFRVSSIQFNGGGGGGKTRIMPMGREMMEDPVFVSATSHYLANQRVENAITALFH
jgi:hypothetical protein